MKQGLPYINTRAQEMIDGINRKQDEKRARRLAMKETWTVFHRLDKTCLLKHAMQERLYT